MAKIFAPAAESAAIKQVTAPAAATSNAAPPSRKSRRQTRPRAVVHRVRRFGRH